MKAFKTIAVVGILGMAVVGCANQDGNVHGTTENDVQVVLPMGTFETCNDDDAANFPCVWNAEKQGNGKGESFVRFGIEGEEMLYLTHNEAERLAR